MAILCMTLYKFFNENILAAPKKIFYKVCSTVRCYNTEWDKMSLLCP